MKKSLLPQNLGEFVDLILVPSSLYRTWMNIEEISKLNDIPTLDNKITKYPAYGYLVGAELARLGIYYYLISDLLEKIT